MTENEKQHEKILFKYHSNILDKPIVETMWAEVIDKEKGIYKLDTIPFYGPEIATDDEFYAEFDESENMLTYRKTTKHSGNSIVLVVIMKKGYDKELIRNRFKEVGCESEGLNEGYFSMEILKSIKYPKIKILLDAYTNDGIIDYAEPCLSDKHWSELENN